MGCPQRSKRARKFEKEARGVEIGKKHPSHMHLETYRKQSKVKPKEVTTMIELDDRNIREYVRQLKKYLISCCDNSSDFHDVVAMEIDRKKFMFKTFCQECWAKELQKEQYKGYRR